MVETSIGGIDRLERIFFFFLRPSSSTRDNERVFVTRILSLCRRQPIVQDGFIMGVALEPRGPVLYYNPEWTEDRSHTPEEFAAVFHHEALHLMMGDIPRFLRRMAFVPAEDKVRLSRIHNLAMDAANNSDQAVYDKTLRTHDWASRWIYPTSIAPHLEDRQDASYYLSAILIKLERDLLNQQDPQTGAGGSSDAEGSESSKGGSAPQPNNGNGDKKDIKDKNLSLNEWLEAMDGRHRWMEAMKEALEGAAIDPGNFEAQMAGLEDHTNSMIAAAAREHIKQCGSVPAGYKGLVDALIANSNVVPWQTVLRQVLSGVIYADRQSCQSMPRRRTRITHQQNGDGELVPLASPLQMFPGSKRQPGYSVLVSLDTSGSMSNEDIVQVLSTIQNLCVTVPNTTISAIQVDTHISDVYVFGAGEDANDYLAARGRTSAGGTHFDAPFELNMVLRNEAPVTERVAPTVAYLSTHGIDGQFDLIVYLTDGYGSVTMPPPPCPVVWVITPTGQKPHFQGAEFGIMVHM